MSRDSSPTYIHLHASHHADLFEEFCRPPSLSYGSNPSNPNSTHNPTSNLNGPNPRSPREPTTNTNTGTFQASADGLIQISGSFLPFEEIHLPSHLMPLNPEDEDDVVPDMHAAFGIETALGQNGHGGVNGMGMGGFGGARREERWRDLGMEGLLGDEGSGLGEGGGGQGGTGRVGGGGGGSASGMNGVGGASGGTRRLRREGRRTGLLLMR